MFTLHPHCSHKPQPLDGALFGFFKACYAATLNPQLVQRINKSLSVYNISQPANIAHVRAMTPSNIISGFRQTGIFLIDKNILQKIEFLGERCYRLV